VHKQIPEIAIEQVAQHINERNNKAYSIPVVGNKQNIETPQVFEILPFNQIDNCARKFYAIDGSYNSQEFHNGVCISLYTAGYICYHQGRQIRLNNLDDPVILGKSYYPQNILITDEQSKEDIYDELLTLAPVKSMLEFFGSAESDIFALPKTAVCQSTSSLLGFCQEVLEWALFYEIMQLPDTKTGDVILRDGTLRSLNIKQKYLVKLAKEASEKGIFIIGITKKSPIKLELGYTLKQIDDYLQGQLKSTYPFKTQNKGQQKLCCWFEIPEPVLLGAYKADSGNMFIKKDIIGGRGFGVFYIARLDYVEKLQNYDWVIVDINIFDCYPNIEQKDKTINYDFLSNIMLELTRLTQEHYILGYPYPLAEAHNFITLKRDFKEEIVSRVKFCLYKDKRMDHIDIENLFLDIHDSF